jgi:hypothetical protein
MKVQRDKQRLSGVDDELQRAWWDVGPAFEQANPGSYITVTRTGGYRTPSDQKLAKLEGASPFDGQHAFSKHQKWKAEALDFAVIGPGEDYIEDGEDPRYAWVGREFEKKGFSWGGRWRTSKKGPDYDHVEKRGPNPTKPIVDASYSAFVAYTGAGATKEA